MLPQSGLTQRLRDLLVILARQRRSDSGHSTLSACVGVCVSLWCFSRCCVRTGVCTSAGDRREERYHPSSPCTVCVGESVAAEEVHRYPEPL